MSDLPVTFPDGSPLDPFTTRWYQRLPGCYQDVDLPLGFPLLAFLACLGQQASAIETLVDRFSFMPGRDPEGSTNDLVNPATADDAWLPWIAQFLGLTLDTSLSAVAQRAVLTSGLIPGTYTSILATAKAFLSGSKHVVIIQDVGDEWHFTVEVYLVELGGGSYGQIQARYPTYAALEAANAHYRDLEGNPAPLQAALQAQVPAGMIMTFTVLTGPLYGDVEGAFPTYTALEAMFSHYSDLESWTP